MLLVHWFNWFSDGLTTIVWSYSFVVTHLKGVEQGRYVDVLPIVGHSSHLGVDACIRLRADEGGQDAKDGGDHPQTNVLVARNHYCRQLQ